MTEAYTLAYSPCPNDTYIFAALTNGLLADAPRVRASFADVEALNESATHGEHALTKVSYGAIPHLMSRYRILRSGGALGRGCGPLLVACAAGPKRLAELHGARIAIPGDRTTAHLLLRLAFADSTATAFTPVAMRFDRIIPAVAASEVDAGLIIHESRFTYRAAGLESILDLGDWWESKTALPIPLGAILVRNDLDDERAHAMDHAIRRSLAFARTHEDAVMGFVREHATEMDETVMRKHIALYVNEFSDDLGDIGIDAVRQLFDRAAAAGIFESSTEPRFV